MEPTGDGTPELVYTPGMGAIADIAAFLKMNPANDIKCVAYFGIFDRQNGTCMVPVIAFLRGDHEVNEAKLNSIIKSNNELTMIPDEGRVIEKIFNGPKGFLGPVGLNALNSTHLEFIQKHGILPKEVTESDREVDEIQFGNSKLKGRFYWEHPIVILDAALEGRTNMIAGANKLDYHLRNVVPGRDFTWTLQTDIRSVNEGEACPQLDRDGSPCSGALVVGKAVEVGHIFKLGYKYTESMGARVLDVNGKEVTPIMGSYGIGIERILTAAIEQSNDQNGFWLSASIAPFTVVVTVTNVSDIALREAGEKLAGELDAAGLDVLLDDRDERAGVKFKDADLVGIPYRINVGKKAAGGQVELVTRATATSVDVALEEVVALVKTRTEEDKLLTAIPA
jgi:prolyl-tRNA synthetase